MEIKERLTKVDNLIEVYEEGACDLGEQDDIDRRLRELYDQRGYLMYIVERTGSLSGISGGLLTQ